MGGNHSKNNQSTTRKKSLSKYHVNKNEHWCEFHKKMIEIPEDLLGVTKTARKMVEDILMEYKVNNEGSRAFDMTKKLDKLVEEIMEMKAGQALDPQEKEFLKLLNETIRNQDVLQEIRDTNIHEKMSDETVNYLPNFDVHFMPTKDFFNGKLQGKPAWRVDIRDIATLLKHMPDLPNLNGKLRMPSYHPSSSLGAEPRSLRAMSSIDPKNNPIALETVTPIAENIEDIPIMPELNVRTITKKVSKIEKDFLKEQIDALFGKMEEEFKEQKIDIAYDILKQIKEFIKKGEFDEWVDFYINSRMDYKILMDDIETFYQDLVRVIAELDDEEGYSLDSARADVNVKYKKMSKGRVALKFDAVVDVPVLELITLLQEPEGYTTWSPYCAEAKEITKLGRAGNVVWMKWDLPKPISAREGLMMGIGFNRMDVNGSVLVMSRTVDNDPNIMNRYDLPGPTSKNPRMDIEFSGVQLVPITKNKTQFKFVVLSDPKVKLIPASLISWIARRGAGDMFDSMISAAKKLKGPSMEKSMEKNREFYDWLTNLIDQYLGDKEEAKSK